MTQSNIENRYFLAQCILRKKACKKNNPPWSYTEILLLMSSTLHQLYDCNEFVDVVHYTKHIFAESIDGDQVINILDELYKEMQLV